MLVYSRYSDFIVHELALDGSVVKLTDLSLPQESAGDAQVQYGLQPHSGLGVNLLLQLSFLCSCRVQRSV